MCYKMKRIALGILMVTMAVFSSNAQAVVISFEQSEGFPAAAGSYAGMAVPAGVVDNWTAPTGSDLFTDDGPGGLGYTDAPTPVTGSQEAAVSGPANANPTVVMDLNDGAYLNMSSFYWAWRGNGNSRCGSEQTAFMDVKYYDLSGTLLGTDTFCGGLNPDWSPKWTLATPLAPYQGIPLSKIEFIGRITLNPPWYEAFFLDDITVVPIYPASTATSLATDISMNQYKLKDTGDIITKGPWRDARIDGSGALDSTAIIGAINNIGTSKQTLLLAPGTWTISANVTVPSNINIRFEQGAILSIGAGYTFLINGPIEAPIVQIASGSGTLSFGAGYVKEVYPQWWGAKGDGTDDTAAINAAINSGCPRICFVKPSVAYAFTGLTIGAGVSNLSLVGVGSNGGVQLRYTPTTGNGITFAGEADNFYMENIELKSEYSSSGAAFYSNNLSTAPLRDTVLKNVSITYFLKGVVIQGGQNIKIIGGNFTGQGETSVGGIGIQLGEDATHVCTQALLEHIYVSSYETDVYNKYCYAMHLDDLIIGFASVALKIDPNQIVYAENLYWDSWNDTAINNNSGYLYYKGSFTSAGTQEVTTTAHRILREGPWLARVNVYRGTSEQVIPNNTATKLQFNAEREDSESLFDSTTNYRYTAAFHGYHMISTMVQWRAGTTNKQYKTMIYKNGALLTEHIAYSRGTTPYYFSVPYSTMVWLDKNDYIEVYVQHDEGVNANIGIGDGKTYLTIISK